MGAWVHVCVCAMYTCMYTIVHTHGACLHAIIGLTLMIAIVTMHVRAGDGAGWSVRRSAGCVDTHVTTTIL